MGGVAETRLLRRELTNHIDLSNAPSTPGFSSPLLVPFLCRRAPQDPTLPPWIQQPRRTEELRRLCQRTRLACSRALPLGRAHSRARPPADTTFSQTRSAAKDRSLPPLPVGRSLSVVVLIRWRVRAVRVGTGEVTRPDQRASTSPAASGRTGRSRQQRNRL